MRIIYPVSFIIIFCACSTQGTTKAEVFERTELANDSLLIKYRFQHEGKVFTDSAATKNTVTPDTIEVEFNKRKPSENSLHSHR